MFALLVALSVGLIRDYVVSADSPRSTDMGCAEMRMSGGTPVSSPAEIKMQRERETFPKCCEPPRVSGCHRGAEMRPG